MEEKFQSAGMRRNRLQSQPTPTPTPLNRLGPTLTQTANLPISDFRYGPYRIGPIRVSYRTREYVSCQSPYRVPSHRRIQQGYMYRGKLLLPCRILPYPCIGVSDSPYRRVMVPDRRDYARCDYRCDYATIHTTHTLSTRYMHFVIHKTHVMPNFARGTKKSERTSNILDKNMTTNTRLQCP